jgi:ubiquinone/menaquinone biosynthesis C-methylase UbiE
LNFTQLTQFKDKKGEKELEGTFYVADVRNLNQTKSESVDHAISYGVFYYLENEENAEMALKEMLRYPLSAVEFLVTRNIFQNNKVEWNAVHW